MIEHLKTHIVQIHLIPLLSLFSCWFSRALITCLRRRQIRRAIHCQHLPHYFRHFRFSCCSLELRARIRSAPVALAVSLLRATGRAAKSLQANFGLEPMLEQHLVIGRYPASLHLHHLQHPVQIGSWRQILRFYRKLNRPQPHVVSRIRVLIVFQSQPSLHVSLL